MLSDYFTNMTGMVQALESKNTPPAMKEFITQAGIVGGHFMKNIVRDFGTVNEDEVVVGFDNERIQKALEQSAQQQQQPSPEQQMAQQAQQLERMKMENELRQKALELEKEKMDSYQAELVLQKEQMDTQQAQMDIERKRLS